MKSEGRVFLRGTVFWIAYYVRGKEFREPGGKTEKEAAKRLKVRLAEKHGGRFIGPEQERVTVGTLLDSYLANLERKKAKGIGPARSVVSKVRAIFGDTLAVEVSVKRLERFVESELVQGKAPATVNRALGSLRSAFHLAQKQGCLSRVPYFPMLREDNARQGFFEEADFQVAVSNLSPVLADLARFAHASGWRKGEILALRWENVDWDAGEVQIPTSKNDHGRVLPVTGALKDLVERRWQAREYLTPEGVTAISRYVFHRAGAPVGDFRKAWAAACEKAGVPGKLFHDLRRTAVRNMIRAGVPQTVAMSISGHLTVSMFNRYNVSNTEDRRQALNRTEAHLAGVSLERKVASIAGHGQKADNEASEKKNGLARES